VLLTLCLQDFFRALSLVRSRTFSGPYVASSLGDRGRLAALVAALVAVNTALGGDLSRGLGAAAAVFLFNVIYEVVLSNKLKQYAMCPVIDLLNHSSYNTVRWPIPPDIPSRTLPACKPHQRPESKQQFCGALLLCSACMLP
jgi:hypothetical protein